MLLPVLGFVDMSFMGFSLVADHLQYAAMIGVIALVSGVAASACPAGGSKGLAGKLAAAACVAALGPDLAPRRTLCRRASLWKDNLARNPSASIAGTIWGSARNRAGRYDEAVRCFDRELELSQLAPRFTTIADSLTPG